MESKYTGEIVTAYNSLVGDTVDLAKVIDQLKDVIVDFYNGAVFNAYKGRWNQCVIEYFKAMDIDLPKTPKPNWENITAEIIDRLVQNRYGFQTKKKRMSINSSTSTSSSLINNRISSTASTSINENISGDSVSVKIVKLNDTDKARIKALYDGLDKKKMWKLSTGTVVEEQMKQFALSSEHEHLSHSLILDVKDTCWNSYFTEEELSEIKQLNAVQLPELPNDAKTYLDELEATSNTDLYNKVNATQFESNMDCKWIQDSYNSCFRLVKSEFFPLNGVTEQAIIKRMWSCLDTCYDFSTVRCISGEKCSTASADAANINRSVSDLNRQQSGRKMDYLFKTKDEGLEIGCGECALIGGVNTTKELSDASFKMPKVMKDMVYKIVALSPNIQHKLVISGVYIGKEKLKLLILDSPSGYVVRYDAFAPVSYPMSESKIRRRLSAVLKMVISARIIMEQTNKKLDDDDSEVPLCKDIQMNMAPSFMPCVFNIKKRKL